MTIDRRDFLTRSALALPVLVHAPSLRAAAPPEAIAVTIETRATAGALAHVWEECAGSDRAAISLRESWRHDLDRWTKEIGLKRVRFHGIFNDELGVDVATWLNAGKPSPNFHDVFEVYDGLIARGVTPYVELSFMPRALASGTRTFGFYNGNVTPPADMAAWSAFITTFIRALADRYGIAAIRKWPFEVWNEPNLSVFWAGGQAGYFDLYKATATAIKGVDPAIPVGGPSTSSVQWIAEFLAWCAANNAPVDFVSTHCYAGDPQPKIFGATAPRLVQYDVIPAAIAQARQQIDASRFSGLPLWLSEWSSDSPAMMAHVISGCLPHLHAMSHWALSGTYEEIGVPDFLLKEGDNGFPCLFRGIARPNFNTYKLLHALGHQRLHAEGPALATRGERGTAALVWNLADVPQAMGLPTATSKRTVIGSEKRLLVHFAGARPGARAQVRFVDQTRGSPMPAWRAMGSPRLPTEVQIAALRRASEIPPAQPMRLDADSRLALTLPPEGVALIEVE
ncbi:MAG: hypothetical protein KGK11_05995 [Sphingomonadales bacterium]|nr:hypothetical protein [Sphingomonadales bacterium]